MKWEKLKPPEPDDPMCCCECDVFQYGCCCDCEDVDEAFNRWLRDRTPKSGCHSALLGALIDNLEISMVPALVLLPLLMRVAALHYLLGIMILTALPGLVLWLYYATHRRKRRTLFFLTLALYSLAYMYYLFITEILPRGDVNRMQLCIVTTGMILTIVSLVWTKRGPGFVRTTEEAVKDLPHLSVQSSCTRPKSQFHTASEKWSWCPACKIKRPPRAGHCRTCGACVQRLDHHCVWINSCVGQANHRSFLLTLCVFLLTSLYGIGLVLRSLCPQQYLVSALFYCPGVYTQSSSALCFTCAWYSVIVTGSLLYLLVAQVMNISFNVTEREAQLALRNKTCQKRLWGLVDATGTNSRGFYQNWVDFLTMADASTMAGKWYLIGFASNGQWFVDHRASMKMGTAILSPNADGDLDISYASLKSDGSCWRMNNLAKKTDVPGKFTYTSWGNANDMRVVEVKYDQYALTHTITLDGGNPTVVNKLYGRAVDLSTDVLDKFRQFSLDTGILPENTAFLPKNGECPAA
ncbi:palmitoyltransferase ZDHHC23-A-like [Dunckerocampus dactyliophorus]|uniref:palmitoyltransferase ZDHHC23-A-like n=1 Tax=Dunckerocampus dactyliophorus TaxID=161453 RepID=UPI0024066314|nr:palmitoyltransferase ZDHHC23-A-like [Dunckerocampus dactyliophorus]